MIDQYKQLVSNQYEAALFMLAACIDQCPDDCWHAPVVRLNFCQVAFHALIFTDLYLGSDEKAVRQQPFHRKNAAIFADYEEFEDRAQQQNYGKAFIKDYLQHCRDKATHVIAAETVETLAATTGFPRKSFSRSELHLCNIRHIQHHTAQLSLRLRIDSDIDVPWSSSGWL